MTETILEKISRIYDNEKFYITYTILKLKRDIRNIIKRITHRIKFLILSITLKKFVHDYIKASARLEATLEETKAAIENFTEEWQIADYKRLHNAIREIGEE